MRVVPFKTTTERRAYRNRRKIVPGETCYAVQDEKTKLYFAWSYTNESFARQMIDRVTIDGPTDRAFNWKRDVQDTTVSSRESF